MAFSRRIRAVLVTAVLWGAAWFAPGLVWIGRTEMHRSDGLPFSLLTVKGYAFQNWAVIVAIGGTLFALTLGLAERRRSSLDSLSMRRVNSWGAIDGAAFPLVVIPLVPFVAPEFARQLPDIRRGAYRLIRYSNFPFGQQMEAAPLATGAPTVATPTSARRKAIARVMRTHSAADRASPEPANTPATRFMEFA